MTFLLDTSVVIAALVREPHSLRVENWLRQNTEARLRAGPGELELYSATAIASWVETEVSSALAMKRRLKLIAYENWLSAIRFFGEMTPWPWSIIDVTRDDFEDAARLCDDFELGLRAPDALHLAVAARTERTLVTFDQKLMKAASILGYKAVIP